MKGDEHVYIVGVRGWVGESSPRSRGPLALMRLKGSVQKLRTLLDLPRLSAKKGTHKQGEGDDAVVVTSLRTCRNNPRIAHTVGELMYRRVPACAAVSQRRRLNSGICVRYERSCGVLAERRCGNFAMGVC